VVFWHKGGDWVEKKDLTVLVINKSGNRKEYRPEGVFDHQDNSVEAFDLGGYAECHDRPIPSERGDIVRLVTPKNVIYSGVVPEAKIAMKNEEAVSTRDRDDVDPCHHRYGDRDLLCNIPSRLKQQSEIEHSREVANAFVRFGSDIDYVISQKKTARFSEPFSLGGG